jgi:hypothetical protein
VNVRNLPNDFGKKGDWLSLSGTGGASVVGGLGSGSYYRSGYKDRVEDCLSLDVRIWRRDGWLEVGSCFTTTWRRYTQDSSIGVQVLGAAAKERAQAVRLEYSWGPEGCKEDVSYMVALSWTPCNFGGSRPWFVCPGVVRRASCGRQVAKLYLKGRYFLCRHCHDLTYTSRQETSRKAALHKCRRIRRRLGGSANLTQPFPQKPKGMHHKTYRRLFEEYVKADEEYTKVINADLERLTKRVFRDLGTSI